MQILKLKLSELTPNTGQIPGLPSNPRQWTKGDVDKIAKSLKETPELFEARPIIAVEYQGQKVILGGNLRYEGARKNKDKEAPVIVFPENTPIDLIKRIVILDNGSFGAWDFDQLANEWDNGMLLDWGVPAWDAEQTQGDADAPEAQEDDFDETADAVETRCKPGDIWQLGNHRLMCGDSTDAAQVALLMNGEKADMVFTDPPYGYQYQSNFREKTPKMAVLKNDDRILNVMPIIAELCEGWVFLCTTWKVIGEWLTQFTASRKLTNMIVWSKGGGGLGDLEHTFSTDYEIILVSNGGRSITGKRLGSVWEIMRDSVNNYEHPTQKPVQLPATAIENVSKPGDSVLDLFGGSGSTLIAAEQLGRKCYMMELDPHFCDVILARWEKLTGQTATKI